MDLKGEVHSICDLWISDLQKCKGNVFSKVGRDGQNFSVRSIELLISYWGVALFRIYLLQTLERNAATPYEHAHPTPYYLQKGLAELNARDTDKGPVGHHGKHVLKYDKRHNTSSPVVFISLLDD